MVCTFLLDAHLPGQFWVDAAYTTTFIINRPPTHLLDGNSPYEKLFHKTLDYSFLHVFECECFLTILTQQHKLELRSKRCVFLGYTSNYKEYQCFYPTMGASMLAGMFFFMRMSTPLHTYNLPNS